MKPKIIIVDQNDNIIDYKHRESLAPDDIYRVSALWITNSKGEILLARRHHTKTHHPNKWGPAASGTVDEGETYEINMTKEVGEELGLKNVPLTLGPKIKVDGMYHHFTQWYTLQIDKNIDEFIFQKDEVEEIKWFTKEELLDQLKKNPTEFLPTMKTYFDLFNSK